MTGAHNPTRSRRSRKRHPLATVSTVVHQDFITIPLDATVGDAIQRVRTLGQKGRIFYLYVTDREDRLTGIVSIRNLLVARDTEKITEVYAKGVVALPDDAPIPEAYRLFSQSRFLSLPVIDSQKKICGVVHAHELVNELGKETEDLFEERKRGELFDLLGIKAEDSAQGPALIATGRLPWLLLNILGGALSAFFVDRFGSRLSDAVRFLAFLPILLIVSESIGMQTASVILNNIHRASARSGLVGPARKELAVALILGLCCALLVALPVLWLHGSTSLALSVGVTLFLGAIYVSSLGVALPFLIHRLQIDPRIATGPVVLAMADSGTLLLYLFVSLWFTR